MFSKNERDTKTISSSRSEPEVRLNGPVATGLSDSVSTLGRGMLVTGNVVCAGSMQISGRVVGDIHAANVVILEGAQVEGNIVAVEAIIHGVFRGTIHANSVKLQSTAVVDGEILKQSLTIEQNAQFEGVSRRLDRTVEAPTQDEVSGGGGSSSSSKSTTMAEIVPISGAIG